MNSFAAATCFRILSALLYLASLRIVHLDVKSGNILRNRVRGHVALADFGLCSKEGSKIKVNQAYTRPYRCWELVHSQTGQIETHPKMDVWAYGCVAFEILSWNAKGDAYVLLPQGCAVWCVSKEKAFEEWVSNQTRRFALMHGKMRAHIAHSLAVRNRTSACRLLRDM